MAESRRSEDRVHRPLRIGLRWLLLAVLPLAPATGCASLHNWWHNGLKVGPQYFRPAAPLADRWIDTDESSVVSREPDDPRWWHVFADPVLERLVLTAYQQNLPLREAGLRVLESRSQRQIAAGNLFPQTQEGFGSFSRRQISRNSVFGPFLPRAYDQWDTGFDLSWELDIWGRIRRSIEASDAELDASIENYDDVLVTLIGDVAATYIEIRSFDERLKLARQNIEIQKGSLAIAEARFRDGKVSELDVDQAKSNLADTQSLIPLLQQGKRLAANRLAILLGMPPNHVESLLSGPGDIPSAPEQVAAGIPAELLRRRPDIRRAERQVAAQSARIGIAEADLYPQFGISGTIQVQAINFSDLFTSASTAGVVTPGFRWKILNYGRIRNNIRVEDARFQQQVASYENTVLNAQREVEDALVQFLRSKERSARLQESANAAARAVNIGRIQYDGGKIDFNQVFVLEASLVARQDKLVQSRTDVAVAVVRLYKALGGGWQMRLEMPDHSLANAAAEELHDGSPEEVPAPLPNVQPLDAPRVEP